MTRGGHGATGSKGRAGRREEGEEASGGESEDELGGPDDELLSLEPGGGGEDAPPAVSLAGALPARAEEKLREVLNDAEEQVDSLGWAWRRERVGLLHDLFVRQGAIIVPWELAEDDRVRIRNEFRCGGSGLCGQQAH
jgi:hypothetical protein